MTSQYDIAHKASTFFSHTPFPAPYRVRGVGRFQAVIVNRNAFQRSKQ
jgi:hypothetical protein